MSGVTLTRFHSASDSKLGTAEHLSAPAADSARQRDKFKQTHFLVRKIGMIYNDKGGHDKATFILCMLL